MNKKTTAIILTIASILLCGCPGLFILVMGGMFTVISVVPGANIDVMGSNDPQSALMFGVGGLIIGILFLLVTVGVIFIAWRRNKNSIAPVSQ